MPNAPCPIPNNLLLNNPEEIYLVKSGCWAIFAIKLKMVFLKVEDVIYLVSKLMKSCSVRIRFLLKMAIKFLLLL